MADEGHEYRFDDGLTAIRFGGYSAGSGFYPRRRRQDPFCTRLFRQRRCATRVGAGRDRAAQAELTNNLCEVDSAYASSGMLSPHVKIAAQVLFYEWRVTQDRKFSGLDYRLKTSRVSQ